MAKTKLIDIEALRYFKLKLAEIINTKQDKSTLEEDVKAFINADYIASLIDDGDQASY